MLEKMNHIKSKLTGLVLIIVGIVFNPWVVEWVFSPDKALDPGNLVRVIIFDSIIILYGLYWLFKEYLSKKISELENDFFKMFDYKIFLIILFFAILIIFNNLGHQILTGDEAWAANCVLEPTIKETIFCKLQTATNRPPLFLIATKSVISILGKSEFAFRLIPAILGSVSIILIYLLSRKITKNETIAILSAALFAFNPIIIIYSRVFKPYIGDVFFALLLFYLVEVYISKKYNLKYLVILTIVSIIAIWFSYTAIFIVPTIAIRIIFELYKHTKTKHKFLKLHQNEITKTIIYFVLITINFLIHYIFIIKRLTEMKSLVNFWEEYFIMSHNFAGISNFIIGHSYSIFAYISQASQVGTHNYYYYINPKITLALFIIGLIIIMMKKKYSMIIYCFVPVILVILASAIKKYPYGGARPDLFLIPFIFIYIAITIYYLISLFKKHKTTTTILALIIIIIFLTSTIKPFSEPEQKEEIESMMTFYKENKLLDDYTYLLYRNQHQFMYYGGSLNKSTVVIEYGVSQELNYYPPILNTTIKKVRSNRLWLIFAHYRPNDWRDVQIDFIINLTKAKCELVNNYEAFRASAYLFSC